MLCYVPFGGARGLKTQTLCQGPQNANPMLCYVCFGGARGLKTQTLCYAMFVLVEPRASKRKPYAKLCSFWWSQGPQNANPMLCYVRFGGARGLKTQTLRQGPQ